MLYDWENRMSGSNLFQSLMTKEKTKILRQSDQEENMSKVLGCL